MALMPLNILLVEDESAHTEAIVRTFRKEAPGAVVRVARTLKEYRMAVEAQRPDIVITDINLPDGCSDTLLSSPSESGAFPFIVMTSYGNEQVAVAYMKAGAIDYIVKSPESFSGMPRAVEGAMREWRLLIERKETDKKLYESEERYRGLFDASRDAIMTLEPPSWNFTSGNASTQKMFRAVSEADFSLQGPKDFSPEIQPDGCVSAVKAEAMINKAMHEGSAFFEWTHQRADKTIFPAMVLLSRIQTAEKTFLLATVRDITDQKQAEAEHIKLEEQLRQAYKMEAIGQLAGGVAHDFNNQLSIIQGCAQLLKKLVTQDPVQNRYTDMILNATRHSSELTHQLLLIARKNISERKPVALHVIIDDLINMLKTTFDRRITLKCELKASMDRMLGDATQIHNALLNLALNARDAMTGRGLLTFTTHNVSINLNSIQSSLLKDGNYIVLKIQDTGIGMTPEVKANIFHPFFTTKDKGKGTGLGLASVFGTIKSHGGIIEVESEPGQGTTFTILLPICDRNAATAAAAAPTPISAPTEKGLILVLDDEPNICHLVSQFILALGHRTVTFTDSEEALKYYQANFQNITLVMLDMNMPKASGQEVFVQFRKVHPGGRFLFASGFFEENDLRFFQESGVRHYLQKPYTIELLAEKLKEVLQED